MRWTRNLLAGLALATLVGCGEGDDAGDRPDGPLTWETADVVFEDADVVTEAVTYRADGLLIAGQVCRPKDAGPYPVIVYNHGGFSGLGIDPMAGTCVDSARM